MVCLYQRDTDMAVQQVLGAHVARGNIHIHYPGRNDASDPPSHSF